MQTSSSALSASPASLAHSFARELAAARSATLVFADEHLLAALSHSAADVSMADSTNAFATKADMIPLRMHEGGDEDDEQEVEARSFGAREPKAVRRARASCVCEWLRELLNTQQSSEMVEPQTGANQRVRGGGWVFVWVGGCWCVGRLLTFGV